MKESTNPNRPDVLAFLYPNDASLDDSSLQADHTPFLVAVKDIEELTGLNFFSALSAADQAAIESHAATQLWPGPENTHPHNLSALRTMVPGQSEDLRMMAEIDRTYGQDVDQEREPRRHVDATAERTQCSSGQSAPSRGNARHCYIRTQSYRLRICHRKCR